MPRCNEVQKQAGTEGDESYSGTTMVAHAPLVDAIKIETSGVVIWDENHGVPALDNYQH